MHGPDKLRTAGIAAVPFLACLYFFQRYHSLGYLAFSACALAGYLAIFLLWERLDAAKLGWVALAGSTAGLSALGLWQFFNLADTGDIDQASYACWLWALAHGYGESVFSDFHIFAAHSNYAILLWVPVHWLAGETGIKVGKMVCLAAAAFLIAWRHRGERSEGPWLALAVLLSPPVASQFFFGFQPEFLAAPFLVLAFQAWRDEKLGAFLAYTAFIAINKEVFTLPIAGLLITGLIERRPWRWIAWPAALCCGLMAAYWFVIGPYFSRGAGNHFNAVFPSGPADALSRIFSRDSLLYAAWIALPFLPALATAPRRYLAIPIPMIAFYCLFTSDFREIWRHYTYPQAFLCAAGWMVWKQGGEQAVRASSRILFVCAVTSVLCYPMWKTVFSVPRGQPEKRREVMEIRRIVPPRASILVNGSFVTWFAARPDIMAWEYKVKPLGHFEYVLLDMSYMPASNFGAEDLARDSAMLSGSPAWRLERSGAGLSLFKRIAPPDSLQSP